MEFDEIISFAIEKEAEAAGFYSDLASKMRNPSMRQVFQELALEERGHKAQLERIREAGSLAPAETRVQDLRIAEVLTDVRLSPDMDYPAALVLAMKREKASFKLYSDLASSVREHSIVQTLLALAQEEARHKLRLEIEYEQGVLVGQ